MSIGTEDIDLVSYYVTRFKHSWQVKFRRGLPPGDGVLFYPGEVFSSSHEPIASIRLERILSGMQVNSPNLTLQVFEHKSPRKPFLQVCCYCCPFFCSSLLWSEAL